MDSFLYYFDIFFKLFLSCLLGGIIGYQREHFNRPAGLRTHILVCVGSALVMVTSEYIFQAYRGLTTSLDPARLGAQVISGIGFLGAGTILREGSNIKGLTSAAALWAVSCIGIAVGAGFYFGGICAAVLVYITLLLSKDLDVVMAPKSSLKRLKIVVKNVPGIIGHIESSLYENGISIKYIKLLNSAGKDYLELQISIKNSNIEREKVIRSLSSLENVVSIS